MVKFKTIQLPDPILSRYQENVAEAFKSIDEKLFGNLISNVQFTNGLDRIVDHGLGRTYRGFWLVNKFDFGDIILSPTAQTHKDTQIILKSNANMTCSIYVF